MKTITVATEDLISHSVAVRLLHEAIGNDFIVRPLGSQGNDYLSANLKKFRALALREHVLLITDLDRKGCPSELIAEWCGREPLPPRFLFRIAVRAIEAWLIADRDGLAELLQVHPSRLPREPDNVPDPKRALIEIANQAPRRIRHEIAPPPGTRARQGIGYNAILSDFVNTRWSPDRAGEQSRSLARSRSRMREWLGL